MQALIKVAERSPCLVEQDKLKLILFFAGVKPSTYVHYKVSPANIHHKAVFTRLLDKFSVPHNISRAKGYEEIKKVEGNKIVWVFKGLWYGYDLFNSLVGQNKYARYRELLSEGKHSEADKIAGKLYGYPQCCIKAFHEDRKRIAKENTYYEYYAFLRRTQQLYPFIQHTPCSLDCRETKKLNELYERTVRHKAPVFYNEYVKRRTYSVSIIVEGENDIFVFGKSIWRQKNGHDYVIVTQKPLEGRYYVIDWLSKQNYSRGTVIDAKVTLQYNHAKITPKKVLKKIKNLHHERRFTLK